MGEAILDDGVPLEWEHIGTNSLNPLEASLIDGSSFSLFLVLMVLLTIATLIVFLITLKVLHEIVRVRRLRKHELESETGQPIDLTPRS